MARGSTYQGFREIAGEGSRPKLLMGLLVEKKKDRLGKGYSELRVVRAPPTFTFSCVTWSARNQSVVSAESVMPYPRKS